MASTSKATPVSADQSRHHCTDCGVAYDARLEHCPLCGGKGAPDEVSVTHFPPLDEPVLPVSMRLILHRPLLVGTLMVLVVLLIVDSGTGGASWFGYAASPVAGLYLLIAVPLLTRRLWLSLINAAVVTALILVMLDLTPGDGLSWSPRVALPIVTATFAVTAALTALIPRVPVSISIALSLVGVAVVCLVIDLSIGLLLAGRLLPTWSPYVVVSTVPAAVFLLLLRQTALRYVDLRRRLHL